MNDAADVPMYVWAVRLSSTNVDSASSTRVIAWCNMCHDTSMCQRDTGSMLALTKVMLTLTDQQLRRPPIAAEPPTAAAASIAMTTLPPLARVPCENMEKGNVK
eukprot:GHVU01182015.1.p1 GENE.GHVU01182015.1~~GHVU01182015.1.p1  ORF type:complete len:104 (-),score=9.48 GHVU01182015.1:116-427(-)